MTSGGGVAALMDCAATEMCRLRDGAAMMRKYPPQDASKSPEVSPTLQIQPISPIIRAEERQEKATSTTGTLTSLLQIQLAQINRMSETVRIEVRLILYLKLLSKLGILLINAQFIYWQRLYRQIFSNLGPQHVVYCAFVR